VQAFDVNKEPGDRGGVAIVLPPSLLTVVGYCSTPWTGWTARVLVTCEWEHS
jgi:hypothetical protein